MAILIPIFLVAFVSIFGVFLAANAFLKSKQKQQIRVMLRKAESVSAEPRVTSFLLSPMGGGKGLAGLLSRFHFMDQLTLLIDQAGQKTTSTELLVRSMIFFIVGSFVGSRFHYLSPYVTGAACGGVAASVPIVLVLFRRSRNFAEFEKQFPEALDFLSRSMRAGHGFSIALEMLALDSADPLGNAFRRVSNDMHLGAPLDKAMSKLSALIPTIDVRFFISSVLMQQETGGNLSEVLGKLAHIIRERFRLKGHVKAASAHGRITGLVLLVMPIVVALIMMVTSPQYLRDLAADELGKKMIYGAICGQIVGYFVIKKIINIKV